MYWTIRNIMIFFFIAFIAVGNAQGQDAEKSAAELYAVPLWC